MLDAAPPTVLQRARGRAGAAFAAPGRLAELSQSGSAKAMLPNVYGTEPHLVLVNTAGGVTGGDHFQWRAEAQGGAALTATSQTAERVYRARPADVPGLVETRLRVESRSTLSWLPQETILFEGGKLDRRLTAEMAEDASLTLLESVVLGRAAMGETLVSAHLSDQWRVWRAGKLVYADALRLLGDIPTLTRGPATLATARAFANFVHIAPDAEDRLEDARDLIKDLTVTAGVSAWNGCLALRMVAPDGQALRQALIAFLTAFRAGPLPRVWHM
ncbi:MAG: urease accessory protein UreD [Pseudomonadota bacterium]